ncbi:hypothetical protein [Azospirillum sp. TSO5]|uniref:hypothetical protein n=1 Tax=Azospirillum sp. TSO5 TaxID=716760 RepID=UPI000D613E6F|nr:hypothetical protein [Azospirillum sp. TSO5]PWC98058.1 hypothetical protein TSO5_03390 [Azospirillum sp. TSO5]
MTTITITNSDTGNSFTFASRGVHEAAMDWYNATSKADLIAYYEANGGDIASFWADESHTRLVEDWADRVMELWARNATEQWFEFRAYNSQTLYGFGTVAEADQYADAMNAGKEINLYDFKPLTAQQAAELNLESNSEAFSLEDELRARAES